MLEKKCKKDCLEEVTYRSFREAEDDALSLSGGADRRRSGLLRSRSESNLTSSQVSLPLAVVPINTLHKCLRVLSGSWRNIFHIGGMSRSVKPAVQAKKVPPPAVPETAFRNSGSSFGSAGYSSAGEDIFHDGSIRDGYEMTEGVYSSLGGPGKSPGVFPYPAFTFPGPQQYTQIGNKHAYYHQLSLQEDQGIDMTQSPGRDSPGSSGSGSRHSTVSLDSGRASCALSVGQHRPSLSSSSVGSGESSAPARVERMLLQGVPDHEILMSWLTELHFDEYYPLFLNAGYDMHTISRMTPEDLTAIGIKKPNHRKKLKAEIAQLNISDGLPDYIPGSLSEWLRLLRLEEYGAALRSQGYTKVEDTTQITWEDLEEIGIVKLGHQKRIMLAIKRVQDLRAGKVFPPTPFTSSSSQVDQTTDCVECDCPRVHSQLRTFHQPWEIETSHRLYCTTDIVPIQIRGGRGKSLESLEGGETGGGTEANTGMTVSSFTGEWGRRCYEDGDITPTNEMGGGCGGGGTLHRGGGTLPRHRPLLRHRPQAKVAPVLSLHQPSSLSGDCRVGGGCDKRPPPPVRTSSTSECHPSSVTVVADLHHPQGQHTSLGLGSDASFKSSSSTESDSIPFANENAGTIKQRAVRNPGDFIPSVRVQGPSATNSPLLGPRKEAVDVLDDIGNMLANLTDELDAMLEEEKRQGLVDD